MKLEITAVTSEIEQNEELDKLKVEMFSEKNRDDALKEGNHSIAERYKVTIWFTGIPKIVDMVLNSLGNCCTSEMYNKVNPMNSNSEDEIKLYRKWVTYLEPMIKKSDYGLPDGEAHKLALENACYMLGVFTLDTDMSYTTSITQLNYIIDWCHRFYESDMENNTFNRTLKEYLNEFANQLSALVYMDELRDYKDRALWFLANQTKSTWMGFNESRIKFEESYQTMYKWTFMQLAQAQQDREISLFMLFNGESTEFFVPYIIRGTKFEDIWLADIRSVAYAIPQGTLIDIVETGTTENLLLKCCERLGGRAQLEICKQTEDTLQQMRTKGVFNPILRKRVEDFSIHMEQ